MRNEREQAIADPDGAGQFLVTDELTRCFTC